jgi:hypothetical protein
MRKITSKDKVVIIISRNIFQSNETACPKKLNRKPSPVRYFENFRG